MLGLPLAHVEGSQASEGNVAHLHPHYNLSAEEAPMPPTPNTASFESVCFSAQFGFFHPHVKRSWRLLEPEAFSNRSPGFEKSVCGQEH